MSEARAAIDRIEELTTEVITADVVDQIRQAARVARRDLDARGVDQPAAGTAQEALGSILDAANRMSTGDSIDHLREKLTGLVGVALADLHTRPQGEIVLDAPGVDTVRVAALDFAIRYYELDATGIGVTERAEAFTRFLTGGPPDAPDWREQAAIWLRRKAATYRSGAPTFPVVNRADFIDTLAGELQEEPADG